MKQLASTDKTYCTNDKCENKCDRYAGNYQFDPSQYYSFCYEMKECKEV